MDDLIFPVSRNRRGNIIFGYKDLILERNADNFGREFAGNFLGGPEALQKARPKNSRERFAGEIRREVWGQFS